MIWSRLALSTESSSYLINDKYHKFFYHEDKKAWANNRCDNPNLLCEALDKLALAYKNGLENHLKGGANPGAVICKESMKGLVVLGTDSKENQQTFCQFQDGSLVDTAAVHFHAKLNDKKKLKIIRPKVFN
ncbi:MAG TPA: hypothetical protein DCY86_19555 [Bdellovibrionales bacterium]|nr:hypothetical protein [Bdellovibrionales bacterium]